MSLEAGIFGLLSTSSTLQGLAGNSAKFVFPVLLPETATLPAVTFQIVGGSAQPGLTTSGMQRRRVQIDFWAESDQNAGGTYTQAVALRDATIALLNGFTGELPNGFVVLNIDFIGEHDAFNNDARRYRCIAEFYIDFVYPPS